MRPAGFASTDIEKSEPPIARVPNRGQSKSTGERPAVLVVSDVRAYRDFLARAVLQHPARPLVATSPPGAHALALLTSDHPDLVVLDMRASESRKSLNEIAALAPTARIIVFAVDDVEDEVLTCAEAGVRGYVPREAEPEELERAIDSLLKGDFYVPAPIGALLFRHLASVTSTRDAHASKVELTMRERQILTFLDQGLTNKEISAKLHIEVATVKNHVHNVLTKMRVHSRAQAAARLNDTLHPAARVSVERTRA